LEEIGKTQVESPGEADDADELRGDPRGGEAREDIFMKNSACTFVAWNFLTSDAAKSLPRIGNSDCISELSWMRARAPGYYTLREHSTRANSQERFRKRKGKGRGKNVGDITRPSFLPPLGSRIALVSRFC